MSIPVPETIPSFETFKFPPPTPTPSHQHELRPFLPQSVNNRYESVSLPRPVQPSGFESAGYCPSSTASAYYESHGESPLVSFRPMSEHASVKPSYHPSMLRHEVKNGSLLHSASTSHSHPPDTALATLRAPPCPQCKGHKYGFTAYFHNSNIFIEPPHELLICIEQSYLLRNRLKSLLVNYVLRSVDHHRLHAINEEILEWQRRVECLAREVFISSDGFKMSMDGIEGLKGWVEGMVKRLCDHVNGIERMVIRSGELTALLVEFKKVWEEVWKGFLLDRRNGQRRSQRLSAARPSDADGSNLDSSPTSV